MVRYLTRFFFVVASLCLGLSANSFAGGTLDSSFNGTGKTVFNMDFSSADGSFENIVVIGGNKFLAVGGAEIRPTYYGVTVRRFNSDGTVDTTFGVGGTVITDAGLTSKGMAIKVQLDGKIVVAANSGSYPFRKTAVLRYSADGVLDATFGSAGVYLSELDLPDDIELLADGKILISGVGQVPNTTDPGVQVVRIDPNGTADTTFGTGGFASSTYGSSTGSDKMALQTDGKIVVSGRTIYGANRGMVHRFNADGSPDLTFGTGGYREIAGPGATSLYMGGGVAILPDGKVLVGGSSTSTLWADSAYTLIRLNPDGSNDNTFGTQGFVFNQNSTIGGGGGNIQVQADGEILMNGQKSGPFAVVVRFDAAGVVDSTFGTSGVGTLSSTPGGYATALALQGSNVIAVGRDNSGVYSARVDTTGAQLSYRSDAFLLEKNDQARAVAVQADGKIVAAGLSIATNGDACFSVARLLPGGALDPSFGNGGKFVFGDASEAHAVRVQPDGKIIVAGRYSPYHSLANYYYLFIARLNANGTLDTTFGTGSGKTVYQNVSESTGTDMDFQPDGKIVVVGTSRRSIGDGIFEFDMAAARVDANGMPDNTFGTNSMFVLQTGAPGSPQYEQARVIAVMPNGKIMLAGTHMLRLEANGTVDSTFSSTPVFLPMPATDIKALADGKFLISGSSGDNFGIVRYSGTTVDTTFGIGGTASLDLGGSDGINNLYLDTNGDILAGGFSRSNVSPYRDRFGIAHFRSSGLPDLSFGNSGKIVTDLGGDAEAFAVTRQNDGKVVAAGEAAINIDRDYAVLRYNVRSGMFDFDGDSKTDLAIFRPSAGQWWYSKSSTGQVGVAQFGAGTDKPVPGDFTGDGKTDVANWRPSTGEWFVLRSEDFSYYSFPFGISGDIPATGDFDADGKADAAIYRPSSGTWYVSRSAGGTTVQQFGIPGDIPVVSDYDGDGKADIAIYRPASGQWWINRSTAGLIAFSFGNSTDKAVPGDYTGDGKADVALFRPATGEWFVLRSEDQSYYSFPYGLSTDIPVPGDYDGDGTFDAAVFRPSTGTWFANRSTGGSLIANFGINGDTPVPSAFVP